MLYDIVWRQGDLGVKFRANDREVPVIHRLAKNGTAVLHRARVGDQLVAVNGRIVEGSTYKNTLWVLKNAPKPMVLRFRAGRSELEAEKEQRRRAYSRQSSSSSRLQRSSSSSVSSAPLQRSSMCSPSSPAPLYRSSICSPSSSAQMQHYSVCSPSSSAPFHRSSVCSSTSKLRRSSTCSSTGSSVSSSSHNDAIAGDTEPLVVLSPTSRAAAQKARILKPAQIFMSKDFVQRQNLVIEELEELLPAFRQEAYCDLDTAIAWN